MDEIGKILVYFGLMIAFLGFLLILISKLPGGFPIGRLPGDIYIRRDNFVFYFPITTSILISVIISLIFFLLSKIR